MYTRIYVYSQDGFRMFKFAVIRILRDSRNADPGQSPRALSLMRLWLHPKTESLEIK
jgi:hypothetical protein